MLKTFRLHFQNTYFHLCSKDILVSLKDICSGECLLARSQQQTYCFFTFVYSQSLKYFFFFLSVTIFLEITSL